MKKIKLFIALFLFSGIHFTFSQNDTISVYYDIGKYKLTKEHTAKIENGIEKLSKDEKFHVEIISSCDFLGSNRNNLILSSKRAEAVRELLLKKENLIISSIQYKGVGELNSEYKNLKKGNKHHRRTCIIVKTETQFVLNKIINAQKGDVFIMKNIVFDPGYHLLKKQSLPIIKQLLSVLKEHPKLKIEISGHVCCGKNPLDSLDAFDKGSKTYHLSKNRARHIYNYLIMKNIDSTRLLHKGYGFSHPLIFPEINAADKANNRRVEIKVLAN